MRIVGELAHYLSGSVGDLLAFLGWDAAAEPEEATRSVVLEVILDLSELADELETSLRSTVEDCRAEAAELTAKAGDAASGVGLTPRPATTTARRGYS